MNKTLYFKFVKGEDTSHSIEDYREIIKIIDKRRCFLDRLTGAIRGSFEGEFKDLDIKLIKGIADYLIVNELINLDKVENCTLTQKID